MRSSIVRSIYCWLALAACAALRPADAQGPPKGPPPADLVKVAEVVKSGEIVGGQIFVGTVRPLRRSIVGSAVDGRVDEFLVNEGDHVMPQQPLAELRKRMIGIQIDAAKAQLELSQQELAELENGSRPEEIEQAKARMLGAQATLEYARSKLDRTRLLIDRKAASQDQLHDDTAIYERLNQAYIEARAAHELMQLGPRKEKIAQARAKVDAAQQEVERLNDILEKHTIISPFDGYVVKEYTEVGQWIKQGELVAEVVQIDKVEIEVMVLETYLPRLREGTEARVDLDALPGAPIVGTVTKIVPQADVRSRSFPVQVQLDNPLTSDGHRAIKPGMLARVTLPVERKSGVRLVPKDALVLGGPAPLVYVVTPDRADPTKGVAWPVPITYGVAFQGMYEVTGQLEPGQLVVVEGNERLRPGHNVIIARVKPAQSAALNPQRD